MKTTTKVTYSGWFIVDRGLFVGIDKHGHQALMPWAKRTGIPRNACQFESQGHAESEIAFMERQDVWPLCTFKAELRTWR